MERKYRDGFQGFVGKSIVRSTEFFRTYLYLETANQAANALRTDAIHATNATIQSRCSLYERSVFMILFTNFASRNFPSEVDIPSKLTPIF